MHRIVDPEGRPIVGALLLRTVVESRWYSPWIGDRGLDWDEVRARSVPARTDEQGRAFLPPLDSSTEVAWIVAHPAHLALVVSSSAERDRVLPEPIVLERAPALRALVLDVNGERVEGALVRQRFHEPSRDPAAERDAQLRARRCLELVTTTGADGSTVLFPLPGAQSVFAEHGPLESETWVGEQPAELELVLAPTFTASGRVDPWPPRAPGKAIVQARAATGSGPRLQAVAVVDERGLWGPVRVPLVPAEEFSFRLEAPRAVVREVAVGTPTPGASLDVHFELLVGEQASVRVLDPDREPIAGARVVAMWNEESRWLSSQGYSDGAGLVDLTVPSGSSVWFRGFREGYVPGLIGSITLRPGVEQPFELVLERAGSLEVVCTLDGKPVPDYELLYWRHSARDGASENVRGKPDGRVVLETVPLGELSLMAHAPGSALSEPVRVAVTAEGPNRVTLELPPARRGRGLVVDAWTSRPIEGASVRIPATIAGERVSQVGGAVATAADGRFEIEGLGSEECVLYVQAQGFASTTPVAFAAAGDMVDFGTIALQPQQELEVVLAPEFAFDFSSARARLHGVEGFPDRHFDQGGVARFAGVGPGQYSLIMNFLDGTVLVESLELLAGREWRVVVPLEGRTRFIVEVVTKDGSAIPEQGWLELSWCRADGRALSERRWVPEDGRVEVATKAEGAAVLAFRDAERTWALRSLGPTELEGGEVRLELDSEGGALRIVERDGRPLVGALVRARLHGDPSAWEQAVTTNARGACRLPHPSDAEWRLDVIAPGGRTMIGVPLRPGAEESELVFEADARLSVRVIDDGKPLSGVPLGLNGADPYHPGFARIVSDADGFALHEQLGEGSYRVTVRQAGLWPSDHVVRATRGGATEAIQVRRLGSLELELRRSGAALAGARIELVSEELGESVEGWIASGAVRSSTGELRTDGQGRLRLDGLPRGSYRWSVDHGPYGARSGTLAVPPVAVGEARIELP